MRILLDNCVDVRFAGLITGHDVVHARDLGWQALRNGELLSAAEQAGFAALVTTDKNIRHQQNVRNRQISLITLNPILTVLDYIAPLAASLNVVLDNDLPPGSNVVIQPE